jgi:GxxExxY protein
MVEVVELERARLDEIGTQIVRAATKVHREFGPGLLESAYRACLAHELALRGLDVRIEVPVPLVYEGLKLAVGFRIDILVEGCVVIEVKAIEGIHPVHAAQVLTYLQLTGHKLGYLINFHVPLMKDGIRRFIK